MYLYDDPAGFCVIRKMDDNRAIYADVYGGYYEAPLAWLKKAADILKTGNYKTGLHMIDMIGLNYKKEVQ